MENRRCTVVAVGDLVDELGFCCEWCGKVYKSLVRYHNHIVCTHKLPVPDHQLVNCFHCPRSDCRFHKHGPGVQNFRQIGRLRRHYQEKHMTGHLTCEYCQKQFQLKSALVAHRCRLRHPAIRDSQSAITLGRHVCKKATRIWAPYNGASPAASMEHQIPDGGPEGYKGHGVSAMQQGIC